MPAGRLHHKSSKLSTLQVFVAPVFRRFGMHLAFPEFLVPVSRVMFHGTASVACYGFAVVACQLIGSALAFAQMPNLTKAPLPLPLVFPETKAAVAAGICFLEGPAVDAAGNVFFSDIQGSRILKMDTMGVVTTFREDSGRTNGNTFDAQGR